jgi:threonine/homoserine/homoserine lactone efflux protein
VPVVPMAPATITLFATTAFVLIVVPGPNILFILSRGAHEGRRAAFASAVGLELGTLVHVVGTVVGLSALIASSTLAFNVVRFGGAAYLGYLGIRTLLARTAAEEPAEHALSGSLSRLVGSAALVNILNPKVALFFLALLPQYINPKLGSVTYQALVLGTVFFTIALVLDLIYAAASVRVGALMRHKPAFRRWQKYLTAAVLIMLAANAVLVSPATPH